MLKVNLYQVKAVHSIVVQSDCIDVYAGLAPYWCDIQPNKKTTTKKQQENPQKNMYVLMN
jgi:hypothetical protein